ncbi:hypothetical protein TUMEXPCC7403_00265 [Tumidithrix helvetica PCC 7403]|uniref:hypothetical protein n=1 Tax=Tumidithrix helvetica TaxID=3457545 RepID=UPI003C936E59
MQQFVNRPIHQGINYQRINRQNGIKVANLLFLACSSFLFLSQISNRPQNALAGALPETTLWGKPTCDVNKAEIAQKNELRKAAFTTNPKPKSKQEYGAILAKHKIQLEQCRDRTWPKTEAVWIRLYPNDAKPGVLEDVLDRVVNRGYNQIFVEVLYDGRVLLPVADNPTPWRSVLEEAVKGGEVKPDYDLWAETVRLGKERGLKVYGWSFAMNFGYGYGENRDRTAVFALNGKGENSIARTQFDPMQFAKGRAFYEDAYERDHLFVDPYNAQARTDLTTAIEALNKRQPDGMVFDYVRYPANFAGTSLVNNVKQLWIYGEASRKALLSRIPNPAIRKLMALFLETGTVTANDIINIENGDKNSAQSLRDKTSDPVRAAELAQRMLWQLATNHAYNGVIDFVASVALPLSQNRVPVGTVFFPNGNRAEAGGLDMRMQAWDRFPIYMERHPMTYAICADGTCVADQVSQVLRQSSPQTLVCPILAGAWGQSFREHPSFEVQMQAIRQKEAKINCVSHFVYAWMEPESDRLRKAGLATGQ